MPTNHHRLRFAATLRGLADSSQALRALLDAHQIDGTTRYNVELAFEEAGANIVRYSAATSDVEFAVAFDGDEIVMTFEDNGVPFDPRGHAAPVAPASLDDAPVGGLGIVLMRTILKRMDYERTPAEHNLLTLALPAR